MTGKCFASGIEEHRERYFHPRRVQSKCKYSKIKAIEWSQLFAVQKSDLVEIRTCPSVYGSPGYLQEKEDPMKNEGTRVPTKLFIYISDTQGQLNKYMEGPGSATIK